MQKIDINTERLISKLKLAEEFYANAAIHVKGGRLKTQLKNFARAKGKYYRDIINKIRRGKSSEYEDISPEVKILNKINIELDQLSFKNKLDKLLVYCLKIEEELIIAYQKELSVGHIQSAKRSLFNSHLNESLVLFNQLKMTKESLHYKDKGIEKLQLQEAIKSQ